MADFIKIEELEMEYHQLVQKNKNVMGTSHPAIRIPPPLPPLHSGAENIPPSVCPPVQQAGAGRVPVSGGYCIPAGGGRIPVGHPSVGAGRAPVAQYGMYGSIPPSVLPATIIKVEKQEPAYMPSNPFGIPSMGPIPNLFNVFQTIGNTDQLWSCHQCGEKGFTPKDLREHVRKKHWLPCLSCDTYCKDKAALQKHYMKMHSIEGLACKICQKVYSSRRKLQIHKRRVHESNPKYKCDQCGYTARSKYRLQVHKRKHTGLKPLLCPCCGKGYADPSNLNKHIKKVHGGKKWVGLKK